MYTHRHACMHALTHSPTQSLTHSHTHPLTHSHTHTLTHSLTHPLTTQIHTHRQTRMHAHTDKDTHTRTHLHNESARHLGPGSGGMGLWSTRTPTKGEHLSHSGTESRHDRSVPEPASHVLAHRQLQWNGMKTVCIYRRIIIAQCTSISVL